MASNFPQFEDELDFRHSISNLSLVEYVDDEVTESDDESLQERNIKDRNNNGNNRFDVGHTSAFGHNQENNENTFDANQGVNRQSLSNSIHWEQEGQNLVDSIIPKEEPTVQLEVDESQIPMTVFKRPPLRSDSELLIANLDEENISEPNQYNLDHTSQFKEVVSSSNDESEEEFLMKSTKVRTFRKSHNNASFHSLRNLNENNNKKKKSLGNNSSNSSENIEKGYSSETSLQNSETAMLRDRYAKGRFRSVQLSSLRTLTPTKNSMPGSWMIKNVKYGQRLVEKDGTSNIHIMVGFLKHNILLHK